MSPDQLKTLLVIVGPTAVGKTDLCLQLAMHYRTEIVSADSRQFYKEMEVGTAKPSLEMRSEVKHHLVDHLSIQEQYTVKDFENDALKAIEEIHRNSNVAILAGGSGLFVKVVCEGIDEIPEIPVEVRATLDKELSERGLNRLLEELAAADPAYFEVVAKENPQRIIRALEVIRYTKKPFSSFRSNKKADRPFKIVKVGLNMEREKLYDRINQRMDEMIANGLFEEAGRLFPFRNLNALKTVGYTEVFGAIEEKYNHDEAVRLLKRNSRRYAKRQLTWFSKDESIRWFHPDRFSDIATYVNKAVGKL